MSITIRNSALLTSLLLCSGALAQVSDTVPIIPLVPAKQGDMVRIRYIEGVSMYGGPEAYGSVASAYSETLLSAEDVGYFVGMDNEKLILSEKQGQVLGKLGFFSLRVFPRVLVQDLKILMVNPSQPPIPINLTPMLPPFKSGTLPGTVVPITTAPLPATAAMAALPGPCAKLQPQDICWVTKNGLVIDPHTTCLVMLTPDVPCTNPPTLLIQRDHSPEIGSFQYPCCGSQLSPEQNVPWDGQPCASADSRPGCCHCWCDLSDPTLAGSTIRPLLTQPYAASWFLAPNDALVVQGARQVLIEFIDPLTYPAEHDLPPQCNNGVGILINPSYLGSVVNITIGGNTDINMDGDNATDADVEAFYAAIAGTAFHGSADFDRDGDIGTDADISAFWAAMAGR